MGCLRMFQSPEAECAIMQAPVQKPLMLVLVMLSLSLLLGLNIPSSQMCARTIKFITRRDNVLVEHSLMGFHVPLPADGNVFDFMFDFEEMR